MIALAILMGVILLCTNSKNKKSPTKDQDAGRILHGSSSGYDPDRQVHWTREDTVEFRRL